MRLGVHARALPADADQGRPGWWSSLAAGTRLVGATGSCYLIVLACVAGFYVSVEGLAVPYAAAVGGGPVAVGVLLAASSACWSCPGSPRRGWARWIQSRTIDPASAIQYESKWRLHIAPTFERRMVKSILLSEAAVWLTDLMTTYGPSTARSAFLVPNGCLELAAADELIKRNPCQPKVVKKPARRFSKVVAWSDETIERIIEAIPRRIGSLRPLDRLPVFGRVKSSDFRSRTSISKSR